MNIELLDFHNFASSEHCWFHPAVASLHDGRLFATTQKINGSDFYGCPVFAISSDQGKHWSPLTEIPAFNCRKISGTPFFEGVADVRPFTMQDGTVAAFGCTTFYTVKGNASWDKQAPANHLPGRAVYAIWSPKTEEWSERRILELPGVERTFRTACTQTVLLGQDKILLPIYLDSGEVCDFCGQQSPRYASMTAVYRKNGCDFEYMAQSNLLELPVLRGCVEPSAVQCIDGGFALTLRAEDGHMYRAVSTDGLGWRDLRPWCWDDGQAIETSSTQQHWLQLGKKLYLVYTRRDDDNSDIMRFRAPLYIAEAEAKSAILYHASERVLFPRQAVNGVEGLFGNFHCTQLNANCALVTDSAAFFNKRNNSQATTIVMAALVR